MIDRYKLYFDGASKGNPGISGSGAVIYKNDIEIFNDSQYVGDNETNNVAEYTGLIIGLIGAIKLNIKQLVNTFITKNIIDFPLFKKTNTLLCTERMIRQNQKAWQTLPLLLQNLVIKYPQNLIEILPKV